jgi:hypothetical protein
VAGGPSAFVCGATAARAMSLLTVFEVVSVVCKTLALRTRDVWSAEPACAGTRKENFDSESRLCPAGSWLLLPFNFSAVV